MALPSTAAGDLAQNPQCRLLSAFVGGRSPAVASGTCLLYRLIEANVGGCRRNVGGGWAKMVPFRCFCVRSRALSKALVSAAMADSKEPQGEAAVALRCRLCEVSAEAGCKGRERAGKWTCRVCETLNTLVARNMGGAWLREQTEEDRKEFFKKSKQEGVAVGGRYSWPVVRAVIVKRMTEQAIQRHESGVEVASRPKSVWLAMGYTEEHLSSCPQWTCPTLGEVFSVPTHMEKFQQIWGRAEEKICEQERALQALKGKAAAAAGLPTGSGGDAAELEVPAPQPAAGGHGRGRAAGAGKATAKALERKAAADAKKAAAFNAKQHTLAGKAVAALQRAQGSINGAAKLLQKKKVALEMVEPLEEAAEKLRAWHKSSTDILALLAAGTLPAGSRVAELPFLPTELQETVKAAAALAKAARGKVAEVEAERQAQEAANGDTEKTTEEEKPKRRKRTKGA